MPLTDKVSLRSSLILIAGIMSTGFVFGQTTSVTHTFTDGEVATASEVNRNFQDLIDAIEQISVGVGNVIRSGTGFPADTLGIDGDFYIDVNMHFHGDISEILNNPPEKKLLARADSYPSYDKKLVSQFDTTQENFSRLSRKYDLEINNYFQTGILFFDTSIISSATKNDLIELTTEFPLSITNEQGIMNLYFLFDKNLYSELPIKISGKTTYFYWMVEGEEILITKQVRFQYK